MFITKWSRAGEYIFIKNYSPRSYGAPSRKRIKRLRETPKAMKKYNNQKRAEKLQMLMILNFNKGYHITLDYPKDARPETYEEAEENLRKCLYKVSRRLKRQQICFKYIAVTERGKRAAALHHHVIIEGNLHILSELEDVWGVHHQDRDQRGADKGQGQVSQIPESKGAYYWSLFCGWSHKE